MEQLYGIFLYAVFLLTMGGIYAVLALGLNIQWGFTGLFNAGVAGFFAIGAYTSAFLTTTASERHLGGLALPVRAQQQPAGPPAEATESALQIIDGPPPPADGAAGAVGRAARCGFRATIEAPS